VTTEEENLEDGCTDVDREKGRRKGVALFFLDVDWYCLFGLDQQLYSTTIGTGLNHTVPQYHRAGLESLHSACAKGEVGL
jgi:hypothetical protein